MKSSMDVRSVLYLVAAAVLAPALLVAALLDALPGIVASVAWLVLFPAMLVNLWFTSIRLNSLPHRPARFAVSPKGFQTRSVIRPAAFVLLGSVALAYLTGKGLRLWSESDDRLGPLALVIPVILILAAGYGLFAGLVVGRAFITLSPEGVAWGAWFFRKRWTWDQLNADSRLSLALRDARRSFTSYLDARPWFVANAIEWYVEHPEHRAGIGTQAEHDRLLRDLGVQV